MEEDFLSMLAYILVIVFCIIVAELISRIFSKESKKDE